MKATASRCVLWFWVIGGAFAAGPQVRAALPGDAEAATHGDEAATLQVVEQVSTPDFVFRQYTLGVLSHYSYLLGSGGEALVVDPARDIARYLQDASELKLKITRIYLTHSHADFVAGHTELAKATGAAILVNQTTQAKYPHTPLNDGSEIRFGALRGVVLATPGHTPDGTCLAVYRPAGSAQPEFVLTGDTVFIGSLGRPDLMGGTVSAAELAAMMYHSWHDKLAKLPDGTRVYPAHGAGSLCGAHLSDKPVSTFGEQKQTNPYIQHPDLASFVMALIDGLPEAPQYFQHNAAMNHDGPPLLDWTREPAVLEPKAAAELVTKGAWLVDLRSGAEFAAGHPQGAVNIAVRGRFETWVGIMVPWGAPFVLFGAPAEVKEAAFRLHRVGYDQPAGVVTGGVEAWAKAGLPTQTVRLVAPAALYQQMQDGTAPVIVDVRLPAEWMGLRIGNVLNLPLNQLEREARRLDPSMPVLMVCNSAYRSSMAAGVMQRLGFKDVRNLDGGSEAWIAAGLPTLGAQAQSPAAVPGVLVNLPERLAPETLAQQLADLPGSLDVVDIRPAAQFAEYHIEGSTNVPVEVLMSNPAYLVDKRPLVIVCRDGSISAALGGALVQKGPRPIRVLSGGVRRYWDEIMRPKGIASDSARGPVAAPASPALPVPAVTAPAVPAGAPAAQPAPTAAPAKRRAGC